VVKICVSSITTTTRLLKSRLFDHTDLRPQLHPGEVPVGVLDERL
jgi:hypothetical protein